MSFSQLPVGMCAILAPSAVVTLSGQVISSFSFGSNALSAVIVDSTGIMQQQLNNGVPTQIDASTDWIIPNSAANSSYRVRYTNKTGVAFTFNNIGAENVYAAISVDRQLEITDSNPTPGGVQATFTLEIDDGSVSQDTGAYILNAEREDF